MSGVSPMTVSTEGSGGWCQSKGSEVPRVFLSIGFVLLVTGAESSQSLHKVGVGSSMLL